MPLSSPRRRVGRAAAVSAAALALLLSLPGVATAAPGDLDPSFDGDGRVVTNVTGYENIAGMAVQPDGKIVTVGDGYFDETSGDFVVVRHNPDGSPDTTFGGGDGIVTTDFDVNNDEARAVALQPDGKIVVVGVHLDLRQRSVGVGPLQPRRHPGHRLRRRRQGRHGDRRRRDRDRAGGGGTAERRARPRR